MNLYPIIALWSHPRSMSTAMERIMRERGDLDCAHEPFMYDYYVHREVRRMPMFDVQADQPVAYADIRDMLMNRAGVGPVFFKDMSYYVWEQVLADETFSAALTNCFLIRNPVASIRSYFRLDAKASREEIGLEAQWRHFEALRALGEAPVVVDADDVRRDAKGVMAAMWDRIGLDYRAEAFDWQDKVPGDWQQVEGWHGKVSASSGIRPLTEADLAEQQRKFDDMAEAHPVMRDHLAHHLPYYKRLKSEALQPKGCK